MAPTSKLLKLLPVERKPPAKAMMDKLAPNTAALDTPSVEGEAMELFSVVCIMRPATDKPAPAMIAASTRGTRIFQIIRLWASLPPPSNASSASPMVICDEPTNKHATPMTTTAISIAISTTVFRFCLFFSSLI